MTVCISGLCPNGGAAVCISDMMVSTGDLSMSADAVALKMNKIGSNWTCMMAGDAGAVPEIIETVHREARLRAYEWKCLSREQIIELLAVGIRDATAKRAEARILAPYGLTLANYRDEGPKLGQEMYTRIVIMLGESKLGLRLLLAGFDSSGSHVLTIGDDGIADHYASVGVWAIGSGETAALGYLFNHQVNYALDLPSLLYQLCCAKFSAETSPGVGKKTIGVIMYEDGSHDLFFDSDIEWIRTDWEATMQIALPAEKRDEVRNLIAGLRPRPELKGAAPAITPPLAPQTSSGQP